MGRPPVLPSPLGRPPVLGLRAFRSALDPDALEAAGASAASGNASRVILSTLALSLLNPHVYLDTVMFFGSLAARFPGTSRILFAVSAMTASLVWFYCIGYGARVLAPFFRKPAAWRLLDVMVGFTMWGIALNLVRPELAT